MNGIGGRRRWSMDDEARIVEETLMPGAVVSEIGRRHGLTPQQLFGWRRAARRSVEDCDDTLRFVPAVADEAKPPPEPDRRQRRPRRSSRTGDDAGLNAGSPASLMTLKPTSRICDFR